VGAFAAMCEANGLRKKVGLAVGSVVLAEVGIGHPVGTADRGIDLRARGIAILRKTKSLMEHLQLPFQLAAGSMEEADVGIREEVGPADRFLLLSAFHLAGSVLAFPWEEEGDLGFQGAGLSLEEALVGVSLPVATTDRLEEEGADSRAGGVALSLMKLLDVGFGETGLAIQAAKVPIGEAVGAADGRIILSADLWAVLWQAFSLM